MILDVIDDYLDAEECRSLLAEIDAYSAAHELPFVVREGGERALRYRVIDGDRIHDALPRLEDLYAKVQELVRARSGIADLVPLGNRAAGVNINLTPPGGEYRWHYDRNAVTAILFLNDVDGGETEAYANFRLYLGRWKHTALQRALDRLLLPLRRFVRKQVIPPRAGRIIVMCGDRCLHSVSPVLGGRVRVNAIMTFDRPQARFRVEENLDPYLYSTDRTPSFDPNYRP